MLTKFLQMSQGMRCQYVILMTLVKRQFNCIMAQGARLLDFVEYNNHLKL